SAPRRRVRLYQLALPARGARGFLARGRSLGHLQRRRPPVSGDQRSCSGVQALLGGGRRGTEPALRSERRFRLLRPRQHDVLLGHLPFLIILGIWDGHDSGAALLINGRLAAAANEERFTRRKLEVCFPRESIASCLRIAGLDPHDVDVVAASTDDVAKTLGRWFPSTKERYYQVRRRKARPGQLAVLTQRAKYAITEWP